MTSRNRLERRMRHSALIVAMVCTALTSCGRTGQRGTDTGKELREFGFCYIGGCSSELCTNTEGAASICIYNRQYDCYRTAICERQLSGECGWRMTEELQKCLEGNR